MSDAAVVFDRVWKKFRRGERLMLQGETSDRLHVVLKGCVRVERCHPDLQDAVVLAELGPGQIVGEMGVLDGEPRSATVRAVLPTETIELGADAVRDLLRTFPEATAALVRVLSRRLRGADVLLEDAVRRSTNGYHT